MPLRGGRGDGVGLGLVAAEEGKSRAKQVIFGPLAPTEDYLMMFRMTM